MKFPRSLVVLSACLSVSLWAADDPAGAEVSDFNSASLSEPGKSPDISMLPTLPAVTAEGMPSLSSGLGTASTRVPESAVAGLVALFGYILILRRRAV